MSRRASKAAASSAPASTDAAAVDSGNQAAHGNDGPNARHYNEQKYWDDRYQKQLSGATAGDAAASARPAKKARGAAAAAASADAEEESDLPDSADVTSDWYYSWSDLERLLRKAKVDTTAAALDVGCGMCNIFVDLQRAPNSAEKAGSKRKANAASSSSAAAASSSSAASAAASAPGFGWSGRCIGLDYSPTVIAHMRQTYPDPSVQWVCADACYLLDEPDAAQGKGKGKKQKPSASSAAPNAPPPLSESDRALFAPHSFSLILDKATSDGMLCSAETAGLTSMIYANIARLLAPEGIYVLSSVNEPESAWFGELVVSQLIEHGGDNVCWQIEVHSPSQYTDGEEGAPHVYIIRKHIVAPSRARASTQQQSQREPYTIKHCIY